MSRRRLLALLVLAVLLLLPSTALLLVASSEAGLKAVASRLHRVGPVTLRIEGVEGSLIGGFRVAVVDIEHARVHLNFTQVSGRLSAAPLLWQTLSLPRLSIATAAVDVRRAVDTGKRWVPRFLPSLLTIRTDRLEVASITLRVPNGTQLDFSKLTAQAAVYPQQIRVYSSTVDLPDLHLVADGRLRASDPLGLSGQVDARYQIEGQPEWLVATRFDGSLEELPLQSAITAPFHASIEGRAQDLTGGWSFAGDSIIDDFDIVPFGGGKALGLIKGKLALTASSNGFTGKGSLDSAGLAAGAFAVDVDGTYASRVVTLREVRLLHTASRSALDGSGTVTVTAAGPKLDLKGNWRDLRWPLVGNDPPFRSNSGRFRLDGMRPYAVEAEGLVSIAALPQIGANPARLRGRLASDALAIEAGSIDAFDGHADATGEVTWSPRQSWRLTGTANNFNPQALRPDLPGRLGFDFTASGGEFKADAEIDLRVARLTGTLRGSSARGGGRLVSAGDDLTFDDVDLRLGAAHLLLDGSIGTRRDLRFEVTADDLSLVAADARGRLVARGELSGSDIAPLLKLNAKGADFARGSDSLRTLTADIDIDLRDGGSTQGHVRLGGLSYAGRAIDDVDVQLDGQPSDHRLSAAVRASRLSIALSSRGAFDQGRWQGQIDRLDINDGAQLKLALAAPAALQVANDEVKLGSLCVKGSMERLCAALESVAGVWHATFDGEKLPLRTLTAGLPQVVNYDGTIGFEAEFNGARDAPPTGVLHAKLQDALLRHRLANGREERFAMGTGIVEATATRNDFAVKVGLDAGSSGKIAGHLDGRRTGGSWPDFPIKGALEMDTDGLGVVDMYFAGIDRTAGRLTTKIDIDGTLGAPTVQGELRIRDGEVDLYQVNLALRDVSFDARFNGTTLSMEGALRAGDGHAKMNGELTWRERLPFGTLHIEGDDLRVVDVPEARIQASPNLDFKLAGRRMDVTGDVKLPFALLEPADITNAIVASSDEVLVGAPVVDPAQRMLVVSNITLTLGEHVSIDTYGLKGRLTGSIDARTDESQVSRGSGELNVAEGKYAAFGRNLDIARGRLIFNNGPLADPGIDLRAQKVYPDVTAGVNVRGSLRAPRLTFFSEPAIPQSQIVSLILAGGSLETVQNSSKSGAARNDLLAQGGAILAQQLGSRVGIEDVSIESDLSNDTSLVLGKYLSPRLYVSYGISLAEAINTVKLRYTIGDHWTVKTESGKARSADLVYTLQK